MNLIALPAFSDNYFWLLCDQQRAIVVDPGSAQPVFDALQREQLQLEAILVTHHHPDHTGGVAELHQATGAPVFGPAGEPIPQPYRSVGGNDRVLALGQSFQVIEVPGHTAGHIAYFCDSLPGLAPVLFCGDTLFSGGCGRLFEGTPAQMLASLDQLAQLPAHTQVCCAHEYTLSNLRFAREIEPHNADLQAYTAHCEQLRSQNQPTLPSSVGQELKINPFLRVRVPDVSAAARRFKPGANDPISDFAALREWKNQY